MKDKLYNMIIEKEDELYWENVHMSDSKRIEAIANHLIDSGLVIVLPCKVGDTVWFIASRYDWENRKHIQYIHNGYVKAIKFSARPTKITVECEDLNDMGRCRGADYHASNVGKTLFLTKEEAEAKLKELKGE